MPNAWKVTDVYRPTGKTKVVTGTGSVAITNGIRLASDYNGNLHHVNRQVGAASVGFIGGWFSASIGSANDLENAVERTQVSVGYSGPDASGSGNSAAIGTSVYGTATSASVSFSMEVEEMVAPDAGSAFSVGPGAIFGGYAPRSPGGIVPEGPGLQYGTGQAGAWTNVLAATYRPKPGGAWSISCGAASVSGSFPAHTSPMGANRAAYAISASSQAVGTGATSSARASDSLGNSTGYHGLASPASGGVYGYFAHSSDGQVHLDRRPEDLVSSHYYDYSSGMVDSDTLSYRNSLYDPGVNLGPPYQTVYRSPDTTYVATGQLLLANGAQAGAFALRCGDSSGDSVTKTVDGSGFAVPFTSKGKASIAFGFSALGVIRNPSDGTYYSLTDYGAVNGVRAYGYTIYDPGVIELPSQPDPYGFSAVVVDGLSQAGATYGGVARGQLLWRAKPYLAYTVAPFGATVPMQPAAGWVGHVHAAQSTTGTSTISSNDAPPYTYHDGQPNLDVEEVGTVSGIDGGVRIDYAAVTPQKVAQGYTGTGGPKIRALGTYYDPSGPPLTVADSNRPYLTQRIGFYRYLTFEVRSVGASGQPCRFGLSNPSGFTPMIVGSSFAAEKNWTFSTAGDGEWTTVEIDLLTPTMPSVPPGKIETLGQQEASRTQLSSFADDTTGGAYTWGVDYYTKPAWAFGAGSAYELRNVRVMRKDTPRVSGLAEIDPSGDHYRSALIEVDGKRSFEFVSSTLDGYHPDPLQQAARMLGSGLAAVPPTDADWGYMTNVSMVGGGGAIYPALPGFPDPRYQDAAGYAVYGQVRWVFAQAAPGMGDAFGTGSSVSGPTPVYACEVYGSIATGVTYGAGGKLHPGGKIRFTEKASGASAGNGTGDFQGRYGSRDPFMRSLSVVADGGVGSKVEFVPNNATVKRICIRTATLAKGGVAVLETPDGTHWRAAVEDGTLRVRTAILGGPATDWFTVADIGSDGSDREPCLTWDPLTDLAHLVWDRDDGIHTSFSDDFGATWSEPMADPIIPGGFVPRERHAMPGGDALYTAIVDDGGSGAGKVAGAWRGRADPDYSQTFDLLLKVSDDDSGTVIRVGGSSDAPAGYDHSPTNTTDGRWNMAIVLDGETGPTDLYSVDDGRTWMRYAGSSSTSGGAGSTGGGAGGTGGGTTPPASGPPTYGNAKYGDAY